MTLKCTFKILSLVTLNFPPLFELIKDPIHKCTTLNHFRCKSVIEGRKSVKINNKLYNCNCRDKLLAINCHHSWCAMKNTQWMK